MVWAVVASVAIGTVSGAIQGDAIEDQANRDANDLLEEGETLLTNAKGDARDVFVAEELASGVDASRETANNISSGLSEFSSSNQLLAANRQAALRESQEILAEGQRLNELFKDRAQTTRDVGRERAQKALVNGIVSGAVSGASQSKSKG